MIKKLAWRQPNTVNIPRGLPGDVVPDKYKVDKAGNLIEIKAPKFDADPSTTDIEVGRDFVADAHSAILWMMGGENVPLPKTVGQSRDAVTLRFVGEFVPAMSRADLEEIIENYRLLSGHFESWAAVVRGASGEIQAVEELTLALAQQNNKVKEQPGLAWALRTLQIRNEIRR